MSQAEMFEKLGAPLNNVRWSWGSVRASDGAVFLRVWQDGTEKIEGKRYIWISEVNPAPELGANERLRHVNLVQGGAACYLIMCQAVDTKAAPRAIQSFNNKDVFETGGIVKADGAYWLELKGRIPWTKSVPMPESSL